MDHPVRSDLNSAAMRGISPTGRLEDLLGYSVMCNRYSYTNSKFLCKTLEHTTGNLTAKFNKSGFPLFVIAYVKMKLREPPSNSCCYECTGDHLVQSRDLLARRIDVRGITIMTVRRQCIHYGLFPERSAYESRHM